MISTYEGTGDVRFKEEFIYFSKKITQYVYGKERPQNTQQDFGDPWRSLWPRSHRRWEYPYLLAITEPRPGKKVLDVGGNNSLFSWFIAEHCGSEVHGLDPDPTQHDIVLQTAKERNLNYKSICSTMQDFECKEQYDIVYCVSVFEHIMGYVMYERLEQEGYIESRHKSRIKDFWNKVEPKEDEWELERLFMRQISKCVKPNGILAMTVDFFPKYNTGPGLRSKEDIIKRIVTPSNMILVDGDVSYNSNVATGSIFLRHKPQQQTSNIKLK